ncbi:MAG: DUF4190 domain-containing protein [Chloroflexi bacterium]|nr:DUF4190 domain-containing protein [Chloroflexota bacterium]
MIVCASCGGQNPEGAATCVRCGRALGSAAGYPPPPPTAPATGGEGIAVIIPYKNPHALMAYYFGIFAIIPCIGLLLGPAAVVLGIMGLKRAKTQPESKGKIHAWVGIICGAVFTLIYLAVLVFFGVGMFVSAGSLHSAY